MNVLDFSTLGLIVLLPLIGGIVNGIFGSKLPSKLVDCIASGAVLGSFFLALKSVLTLHQTGADYLTYNAYSWIYSGDLKVDLAFLLDPLSALMVLIITGVGFLIHLYSAGYMSHDPGKWKFFTT